MECHNHPDAGAAGTCSGCAEPFCPSCLVSVRGATYCASCKGMAIAGLRPQAVAVCQDAKSALGIAFVGIVFLGIVFGAIALSRASSVRRQIEANPALGGKGWADAATAVGSAVIAFSLLGLFARFSALR